MSTSARFSKIVVIQSIPEGELHTGTRLHEDMQIREVYHDRGFNPELHNITSTKELRDLLSELEQKARRDGDWPILHVEAHGNTDGLVLASKEFISWEALKPALIALNVATKNNLLLTLAACYGGHLDEDTHPTRKSPLLGARRACRRYISRGPTGQFYRVLRRVIRYRKWIRRS